MRWQRLRTRTERDALETGPGDRAARATGRCCPTTPSTPSGPCLLAAAVRCAGDGARRAGAGARGGRRGTAPGHPARPGDPAGAHRAAAARAAVPALRAGHRHGTARRTRCRWCPGPNRPPTRYRLRRPDAYPLPTEALANPVCGVLGAAHLERRHLADHGAGRGHRLHARVRRSHRRDVERPGQLLRPQPRPGLPGGLRAVRGHAPPRPHTRDGGRPWRARATPRSTRAPAVSTRHETYSRRTRWSAPFDPDRPIPWVTGYSLRDDRPVLVPARLVYYSAGTAADNFVFECSNGCAIGSCTEEAVLLRTAGARRAGRLSARLVRRTCRSPRSTWAPAHGPRSVPWSTGPHSRLRRPCLRQPGGPGGAGRHRARGAPRRRGRDPGVRRRCGLRPAERRWSPRVSEILTYIPHLPRQVAERPAELAAMAEDFGLVRRLPDHAALFGLPRDDAACPRLSRTAARCVRWPSSTPPGSSAGRAPVTCWTTYGCCATS